MTFACQFAESIAGHAQDLGDFLSHRIARRADQARVREHPADIASPPFKNLVRSRTAVDRHGDVPGEEDEQSFHPRTFRRQYVACL